MRKGIAYARYKHFVLALHLLDNLPFIVTHVVWVVQFFFQPLCSLLGIADIPGICPFTDELLESGHDGHWVYGRIEAAVVPGLESPAEEHNLSHVEIAVLHRDELHNLVNLPRCNLVPCPRKLRDIRNHVCQPLLCRAVAVGAIHRDEAWCIGKMASARVACNCNHAVNMEGLHQSVLVRPSHACRCQPAVSSTLRHLRIPGVFYSALYQRCY